MLRGRSVQDHAGQSRWGRWLPGRFNERLLRIFSSGSLPFLMNWTIKSAVPEEDWWTSKSGGWATWVVLSLMLGCYGVRITIRSMQKLLHANKTLEVSPLEVSPSQQVSSSSGAPDGGRQSVTEADLQRLLLLLEETDNVDEEPWETVVDEQSELVTYCAKRRDPQDGGPTEYLSTTIFENCSTEQLRDFYMDGDYRMKWDSTVISNEQVEVCQETGVEIGRTIKKFPFLSPREYVLAWRVWEGEEKTFYCFTKACEHFRAPRQAKYTRIEYYFSGWRIRKVPGKDACEIKMWHQEDIGTQRHVAKWAFSRNIWSYVCKMETSLRKYDVTGHQLQGQQNAVTFAQKVPAGLVEPGRASAHVHEVQPDPSSRVSSSRKRKRKFSVQRSGRWLASGLLVLGGAVFCTKGSAPLGAKLATAFLIKKMIKPQSSMKLVRQQ